MNDGTTDELRVSFPATGTFVRIGRVTVAGLAIRLGIDIGTVERLRAAIDTAVTALVGGGQIDVSARWQPGSLLITLANPDATIQNQSQLADELAALVGMNGHRPQADSTSASKSGNNSVRVDATSVVLGLVTV